MHGRILPILFAALTALLAGASPATAATTTVHTAQAEGGTLDGWLMSKVADAAAGGGQAVRYDWVGSVRFKVVLPADADAITLRVRGDQCAGAPRYTVTVDGAAVAEGDVTSTTWVDRTVRTGLVAGTHSVDVRYPNDHTGSGCNRNLHLDAVTFTTEGTGVAARTEPIPAGFVHQSGTQLRDGAGRPVRLRGVNLGGWLLWEGWIWSRGTDYIGESAMMANLAGVVGPEAAEAFRTGVRANYVTDADFRAIAAYGLNVVRVPFNYRLLEDDAKPFTYKAAGWDVLDRTIAAAKRNGVYVVLDMHAAPCSQMYAFVSDYVGPDFLWSSPTCQDRMVAMWKAIAARYAAENVIAGYDLLGETIIGDAQLLALYKRVTGAIRAVDRNHLIIYEGNTMARTFDFMPAPLDANQALSPHDYPWMIPGQDFTARMPAYDAAARRLDSPQWVGEFGQSTAADVDRYVKAFNADPLFAGWAQWTWKQSPGFPALQTIQHTAASKKLVDYITNTSRPKPTAAEAAQGMSDFLTAIRFENTVHDAKFKAILTSSREGDAAALAPVTATRAALTGGAATTGPSTAPAVDGAAVAKARACVTRAARRAVTRGKAAARRAAAARARRASVRRKRHRPAAHARTAGVRRASGARHQTGTSC